MDNRNENFSDSDSIAIANSLLDFALNLIHNQEKEIRIWFYKDPALIEYVRENYEDLTNNKIHPEFCFCLSCLYHKYNSEIKGRKGRLQKFPFFIYWLTLIVEDFSWDKIDFIIHRLYNDDPNSIFHFRDFIPYKIKFRYKKRKVIEDTWNSIKIGQELDRQISEKAPNLKREGEEILKKSKEVCKNLDLLIEIFNYVGEKKKTTIREILRKFSIKFSTLIPILNQLKSDGSIQWNGKEIKYLY